MTDPRDYLDYDKEKGEFVWKVARRNHIKPGMVAGAVNGEGYRIISIAGRSYKASRLAWYFVHGEWPSGLIDHINRTRTDDRISNLRIADHRQNRMNTSFDRSRNKHGFTGVYKNGNKWQSVIFINGVRNYLGIYNTPEEAGKAYTEARSKCVF